MFIHVWLLYRNDNYENNTRNIILHQENPKQSQEENHTNTVRVSIMCDFVVSYVTHVQQILIAVYYVASRMISTI